MDRCSASAETCSEARRRRFGERLKEVDANKDGVITLEEFLAPPRPDVRPLRQEQRRRDRARRVRGLRQGERRLLGQALHQALRCRQRRPISKEEFAKARQRALRHARPRRRRPHRPRRHGPRHARARPRWRERSRERQEGKEAAGTAGRRARPTSPTRASAARSISSA